MYEALQKFHNRVQKWYKPSIGVYKAGLMGGNFIELWFCCASREDVTMIQDLKS
jgi:hypothetical protein